MTVWQVAVVGGGPAGLQAALTLGRMHVRTALFDDGEYRNETSSRMHNILGWDGATPTELRTAAHVELSRYEHIDVMRTGIETVSGAVGSFTLTAGATSFRAERVLLATGVRDSLLPIPGLRELWATSFSRAPTAMATSSAPDR